MSLVIGQQVFAETAKTSLVVKKKLGEGGQGAVYLVDGVHGSQALKWYNVEQATEEQRTAIRYLVNSGPPRGPAGRRFIWPQDLVTAAGLRQFGYLMPLIDTRRFADLGEVWARRKPVPGLDSLCETSYQIANSYRALHLSGHCYRDISRGNLMFDPTTGDVLICDNDNVGVNRQSTCQVWGTMEYMAPELIRGDAEHPSTETDLHSLAVLLFLLWVWHHPLHGELEYQVRSWDLPAKKQVYGITPVFIFDPVDKRNRLPNDPDYVTGSKRWATCPPSIQGLFTKAFTIGLKEPARRVTEGEWQNAFLQLKDGLLSCPACRAVNLWEPSNSAVLCWNCEKPITLPPKLVISRPGGKHYVLLTKNAKVLRRHIDPIGNEEQGAEVLGHVAQNPANPQVWGIRNLTGSPWVATATDGKTVEVAPQKAVPMSAGLRVNIGGVAAEIMA
ncbi:MAG: protein kinase domain-containing protein [Planctomycetota bacterium]|jgi:DNA-binding helix-hairpin-helix protein with protein kinase domain